VPDTRLATPPRRGRWNKAERRAQIAAIAVEIIARQGVQAATLERIAKAAGISTPSLYNHFSNRTEILEAGLELILGRVFDWIDGSSNPNALERLREIAGAVHEDRITTNHEWVIGPLFELLGAARTEGLTETMGNHQLRVLQRFIDIVEEGKLQGTIRQDADAKLVGWSVMGLCWTKDFALLQGLDQFLADGTAGEMLEHILSRIAAS
jgi:AcrR family transcriptional regulator